MIELKTSISGIIKISIFDDGLQKYLNNYDDDHRLENLYDLIHDYVVDLLIDEYDDLYLWNVDVDISKEPIIADFTCEQKRRVIK